MHISRGHTGPCPKDSVACPKDSVTCPRNNLTCPKDNATAPTETVLLWPRNTVLYWPNYFQLLEKAAICHISHGMLSPIQFTFSDTFGGGGVGGGLITDPGKTVFYPSVTKIPLRRYTVVCSRIFAFLHLAHAELQYSKLSKGYCTLVPDCPMGYRKQSFILVPGILYSMDIFSVHGLMQGYCKFF
jgi:hypothetical protein